jgi:hypothetical protein
MASFHVEQNFLLSGCDVEEALLVFEFDFEVFGFGLGFVDFVFVLVLEYAEFADLFLTQTNVTFILSILSSRPTLCFLI